MYWISSTTGTNAGVGACGTWASVKCSTKSHTKMPPTESQERAWCLLALQATLYDRSTVAFEHAKATSRLHVPQPHCAVNAAGEGVAAIGAPRHAFDRARVAFEHAQATSHLHIPQSHVCGQRCRRWLRRPSSLNATLSDRARVALRTSSGNVPSSRPTAAVSRSLLPERAWRPSALHATQLTEPVWPSSTRRQRPFFMSHSRSVRSLLPEIAKRPSTLNATHLTEPVWPMFTRRHFPISTSHNCRVRSVLPESA